MKRMQFAAIWLLAALVWLPVGAQESPPPADEVVAPVQAVSVEPVARDDEIAKRIQEILQATGWFENARVSVDDGNDRLNAKIKVAQDEKVPYMLVVGGNDEAAGTVSVRHRSEGDRGAVALETFVADVTAERDERRLG